MERQSRMLGELAELSMSLARRLHEQAMAAEPAEAQALALAFQRVSRGVRQTLALEAKLERDLRRASLDEAREHEAERRVRLETRRGQVKAALSGLIWTEGYDIGERLVALGGLIDRHSLEADFLDAPVEAVIARLRADLGLAPDRGAAADSSLSHVSDGYDLRSG